MAIEESATVNLQLTQLIEANSIGEYATNEDFRRLFTEHASSLYLLSYLLTANHEKAEHCFVTGLDECLSGSPAFREWASTWARRIIVRNAIRMISPHINSRGTALGAPHLPGDRNLPTVPSQKSQFVDVLALRDFERFVYVLSVLEEYSDQDCATLLGVSRQDVRDARTRAFQQIAGYSRAAAVPADHLSDV
jgi:DNA-directed RNA polymerase specialized sigma24 family protein